MVAFLEKHFEFTTQIPIEICVALLKTKSKRGAGYFASRNDILVRISDEGNDKVFMLDRDVGRSLYAEVRGQLRTNPDHSVMVSGSGRISLFIVVFATIYSFGTFYIVFNVFRNFFPLALFWFCAGVFVWICVFLSLKNRNDLIKLVKQTLEANEQ